MLGSPLNRAGQKINRNENQMGHFTDAIRLPSAKFPSIGDSVSGKVVDIGKSNVPDFDDKGRPNGFKYDEDGKVIEQIDVTLETASGGQVVLHTDGAPYWAIGRALAQVGSDDLEVGDTLTVTYTGDGEPSAKGRNAPKQYDAEITKG